MRSKVVNSFAYLDSRRDQTPNPAFEQLVWVDDRFEYAELRVIALAPKAKILYYVAFVDRGEVRRIISLRRANRREVKHYVKSI